jgi:SET domain-containing protein
VRLARIAVGESPIHGRGVFARARIRSGSPIGDFEGCETKRNGTHVLWVLTEDGSEVGIRGENELRFLNHSRRPNAEFRGASLYAVRNIQPGREILIDYGEGWDDS